MELNSSEESRESIQPHEEDAGTTAAELPSSRRRQFRNNTKKKEKKPKEPRPDHFLALQLSHFPHITSSIEVAQQSIFQHSPHLQKALVEPATAHLTLGVLNLKEIDHLTASIAALESVVDKIELEEPLQVQMQGLEHFRNQVVYLSIAEDENGGKKKLLELAATIRSHFDDHGLLLQADREFVAHVTVAKLSKMAPSQRFNRRRNFGKNTTTADTTKEEIDTINSNQEAGNGEEAEQQTTTANNANKRLIIPPESYAQHKDITAGMCEIAELQLCAMEGRKPGKYYKIVHSVKLVTSSLPSSS